MASKSSKFLNTNQKLSSTRERLVARRTDSHFAGHRVARVMAASDTQKLDSKTPDSTWREVLGTAEVSAHAEIRRQR